MHDLDRTTLEIADEASDFEYSESDNEYSEMDPEGTFSEEEEAELAAGLLEINSEEELDQFIGNLLRKAKGIVGGALKSPMLQPLGGLIKGAIKKALPVASGTLGNMLMPGLGGAAGSQLASKAGDLLGLEMENASPEDQEFEVAKRLVRLAGAAVQNAAQTPSAPNPQTAAKEAMVTAAQAHAPGLLQPQGGEHQHHHHHRGSRGHWYRHGNKIVIVGV